VKYGGGAPVRAHLRPDPARGRLLLTIADQGPGVSADSRAVLFERYSRGGGPDHPEGTGIGLYVSRELCRAMGGSLDLEVEGTEPGAAFTISLPAESPAAAEA
jgi:signal transduction histidine kinase